MYAISRRPNVAAQNSFDTCVTSSSAHEQISQKLSCSIQTWDNYPSQRSLTLQTLPEALIRVILEFTAPTEEHHRWLWMGQIGGICKDFHDVTKALAPRSLELEDSIQPDTIVRIDDKLLSHWKAPLLRSFLVTPWKAQNLVEVRVSRSRHPWETNDDVCRALQLLLVKPGALVNVQKLHIALQTLDATSFLDGKSLNHLAQNLTSLTSLTLIRCFGDRSAITPSEFGLFAQRLPPSFQDLVLGGLIWMTNEHVRGFVSVRGDTLRSIELLNCYSYVPGRRPRQRIYLNDATLYSIARHCFRLKQLSITNAHVSLVGLESALRFNPHLAHLNVSLCSQLGAAGDFTRVLLEQAPQLESLQLNYCRWFTNEAFLTYIHHLRWRCRNQDLASTLPLLLKCVDVFGCSVTQADAVFISSTAGDSLAIHGGEWSVSGGELIMV